MAADDTGSVAKAAYGTARDDAIRSDLAPQVATDSGAVDAKVAVPDANEFKAMAPDPDLVAFAGQDGALYYTDAQRLSNQSRIVQDFQQIGRASCRERVCQYV